MKKKILRSCLLSLTLLASCANYGSSVRSEASFEEFSVQSEAVSEESSEVSSIKTVVTVFDANGRSVEVMPGSYKKVVCIGAGALRMYSYVGDTALLAGVEDIDNTALSNRPKMFDGVARPYLIAHEEDFQKLPSCGVGGPKAQAAEPEKILNCAPDIVVSEYEDVDKANALQKQIGVPVITLNFGTKGVFDDKTKASFELLGKVFSKEERAEGILSYVDTCKAEISAKTKDIAEKPKAYICGLGNWGTSDHLMTSNAYPCFSVSNIDNIVSDAGFANMGVQKLEKEKFEELGPKMDVMIIDSAAMKNIVPAYKEDPTLFDNVKAWKEGKVYLQLAYNAYYTNMELMLANTYFDAASVYPETFKDFDMNAKLSEITSKFLGKDLTEKIDAYKYSYGGYQRIDTENFLTKYAA